MKKTLDGLVVGDPVFAPPPSPLDSEARGKFTDRFGVAISEALERTVQLVLDACEMRNRSDKRVRLEITRKADELLTLIPRDFFSDCWAGYHQLYKPLKAFLHTTKAACVDRVPPKRGNR